MTQSTQRPNEPKLNAIFNLGIKAPDTEAEQAFFAALNPDRTFMVQRKSAAGGPTELPAVEISGVKFFLFSGLAYDDALPQPHGGGIGHVSFMVDSLDDIIANMARHGIKPFKGPYVADIGDLGKRKVVFFRSPNGTIIEPQELIG